MLRPKEWSTPSQPSLSRFASGGTRRVSVSQPKWRPDVLGPLPDVAVEALWTCPLRVIPKNTLPGQPQKWRLIVDLSAPRGRSVNDFKSCSTEYVRVADAIRRCALLNQGVQLVKLEIQSAVHPADRHFLGVRL